ncbi:probable DNA double-strand break repair Rad50 ATPase isoform X2 [Osmerus eperlanus]|uniref:probable DNA double-strand break repair Rad50 ATPase isoform X2 n=1 Tax=Osmerus eperlanus TaxID=29151 RepID=UPI002E1687B7
MHACFIVNTLDLSGFGSLPTFLRSQLSFSPQHHYVKGECRRWTQGQGDQRKTMTSFSTTDLHKHLWNLRISMATNIQSHDMEKTGLVFSSPSSKPGILAENSNHLDHVRMGAVAYEEKTQRSSSGHLPLLCNLDTPRSSGSGDRAVRLDCKSEKIVDLEQTVARLKNALVSLEEENLSLNRKIKSERVSSLSNHTPYAVNTRSTNKSHELDNSPNSELKVSFNFDTTHQDGMKQDKLSEHSEIDTCKGERESHEERYLILTKEKQDLEKKLKKTEDYSKACADELKMLLQKYEDFKALNKILNKQSKNLAKENRWLKDTLDTVQAGVRPKDPSLSLEPKEGSEGRVSVQLEMANERCANLSHEKGHLEEKVASLSREVCHLKDELDFSNAEIHRLEAERSAIEGTARSPPAGKHQSARILDSVGKEQESHSTVAQLKEENRTLRVKLEANTKYIKEMKSSTRRLTEEQGLLENCLHTLQMERDLLQGEVRKLHQEYIELSGNVSEQLRERSPASTRIMAGSHKMADWTGDDEPRHESPKLPLHSSPITREMLDSSIGGETIDQIRKRLEEDEQRGAQRYKNTIHQNE